MLKPDFTASRWGLHQGPTAQHLHTDGHDHISMWFTLEKQVHNTCTIASLVATLDLTVLPNRLLLQSVAAEKIPGFVCKRVTANDPVPQHILGQCQTRLLLELGPQMQVVCVFSSWWWYLGWNQCFAWIRHIGWWHKIKISRAIPVLITYSKYY